MTDGAARLLAFLRAHNGWCGSYSWLRAAFNAGEDFDIWATLSTLEREGLIKTDAGDTLVCVTLMGENDEQH